MLKVQVKQKHIKAGKCGDPNSCALALAILDTIPDAASVSVCGLIIVNHKSKTKPESVFELSLRAEKFIDEFDHSSDILKPTVFSFKEVKN